MDLLLRPFRLLFSFSGRTPRAPYVVGLAASAALMMGAVAVFEPAALESEAIEFTPVVTAVVVLGWWSWFALLAKRLRDIGLGWGWALLALIPGFQVLVLAAFAFPKGRAGVGA